MPHIKISNVDTLAVQSLSGRISDELARDVSCPADWFTFSVSSTGGLFCNGEVDRSTVFVHVEWFDRGQQVKDAVAKTITNALMGKSTPEFAHVRIVNVIFVDMKLTDYYENGEHF